MADDANKMRGFLHYGGIQPEDVPQGTFSEYQLRQRSAHFEVVDTEGGASYAARRPSVPGIGASLCTRRCSSPTT